MTSKEANAKIMQDIKRTAAEESAAIPRWIMDPKFGEKAAAKQAAFDKLTEEQFQRVTRLSRQVDILLDDAELTQEEMAVYRYYQ